MPILAGVGVVGSLIGGIFGASSASKAAQEQAQADQNAAAGVNQATSGAINAGYSGITEANSAINAGTATANQAISNAGTAEQGLYGNETAALNPYQQAGTQGLSSLAATAGTFQAPTLQQAENTPGYQFQLQQGEKAIQNSAAATGTLQSGATLKSLDQYSQGLASTAYQQDYNNALSTYNTNQQGYQTLANLGTNANSQLLSATGNYGSQLTSLANLGANTNLQSSGLLANVAQQGNQYIGSIGLQGATTAGNYLANVGTAQAAGTMGAANAWSGALQGVGNAATGYGIMNGLSNLGSLPSSTMNYAPGISTGNYSGNNTVNSDGSITIGTDH